MKILVICQYYYPEPFRVSDICEELVNQGHEITVLTGLPNYPEGIIRKEYLNKQKWEESIKGVKVYRVKEIGRGKTSIKLFLNYISFALWGSLKALKLKEDFDRVFVYQLSPVLMALPGILYSKKHKAKIILYCLDLWPESLKIGGVQENGIIYKLFSYMSKWIYEQCDEIIVSSKGFIPLFEEKVHHPKEIHYLPQYAEDIFLKTDTEKKIKNEYNFIFAGNIGKAQSVKTIIEAAQLLETKENVHFHIIGDGSELEVCKAMACKIKNIKFYGRLPVENMPGIYKMADAMLVTMIDDPILSLTLPGKVQSYMAAGKAIIGAINGETASVIKEAGCGLCGPAEDSVLFAENIKKYLSLNDEQRNTLDNKSYSFYSALFSKNIFIRSLTELFYK